MFILLVAPDAVLLGEYCGHTGDSDAFPSKPYCVEGNNDGVPKKPSLGDYNAVVAIVVAAACLWQSQ